MEQLNEATYELQKYVAMTEQAQQVYLEPLQLNEPLTTELEMNSAFSFFYERYPEHRRPDIKSAEAAWYKAALSDKEARELLEWLIDTQVTQPSWHPLAQGMYVPNLGKFLEQNWWLTPKANRYK